MAYAEISFIEVNVMEGYEQQSFVVKDLYPNAKKDRIEISYHVGVDLFRIDHIRYRETIKEFLIDQAELTRISHFYKKPYRIYSKRAKKFYKINTSVISRFLLLEIEIRRFKSKLA